MKYLTEKFFEEIEKVAEDLPENISDEGIAEFIENALDESTTSFAPELRKRLLGKSKYMLKIRRREQSKFRKRNLRRWQAGFDLLETHIVICAELGEWFNSTYIEDAAADSDLVFNLMVRHHARACLLASEVLTLMIEGFPDGAHARWRALHEVTTTAIFIQKHGIKCAERFYFHDIVESYKGALNLNRYESRIREKGFSEEELAESERNYRAILEQYGKSYSRAYGWAADALSIDRPTFFDIEKDVGLDHMRPYVKWASQSVHAGSKGLTPFLALSEAKEDILIIGPSDSGMTDPAHATAITLGLGTIALLNERPNVDTLVYTKLVKEFMDDIGSAFLECEHGRKQ